MPSSVPQGMDGDAGWVDDGTPPQEYEFTGDPGMPGPIPTTPLGFVQLFLTREVLIFLTEETHSYALYCRDILKQGAARLWQGCNISDIAHFLGLSMLMGIERLPSMRMYWSTSKILGSLLFPQIMTCNRYLQLGRYLHAFNKRAVPPGNKDRLLLVRPIMEYIQERCCRLYIPMQELSLDEGIMPYKGRLSIKTYNPQKPDKYGVKIYFLCEAVSGYVYSFSVYRGVHQTLHEIVFSLLSGLLGKGYHVYMDNYYNSVTLAGELYDAKVHCTGTLRLARKGAPPSLQKLKKKRKLPRNFYDHRRKGNTVIICWYDTRLVSLITTFHGIETSVYEHHKRVKHRDGSSGVETVVLDRPIAIREYTKYMQGVDRLDQLMKYYSFLRKTKRWTKKILFYFIQIGLQNSYTLYRKFSSDDPKLTHLQFHMKAIEALIYFDPEEWPSAGPLIPHAAPISVQASGSEEEDDPDDLPPQSPGTSGTQRPPRSPGTQSTPGTPRTPPSPVAGPADAPEPPPPKRPRIRDPPGRLTSYKKHHLEAIGPHARSQKRCRVCYMNGKRKDTVKQCARCKVPLCLKGPCFEAYHTRVRYWQSPSPSPDRGRGRGGRR